MRDDKVRELVERLRIVHTVDLSAAGRVAEQARVIRLLMVERAEAAAFIEATIATKPLGWVWERNIGGGAEKFFTAYKEAAPNDARPFFLHPDPKVKELREALKTLVDKLDAVHADERFRGVWTVSQMHIGAYAGPTYTDELAAARAALTGGKEMG